MKRFTIGEAAQMADTTTETLRHYDRIGLVKPQEKDEWTGYRYYSEQEIIRLNTIQALRCMDLSLKEIKEILEYDDLEKIVAFLKKAEESANQKIAKLEYAKSKIQLARNDYEKKLKGMPRNDDTFLQKYSQRVILLSDTMSCPTIDNLWNYHSHFYNKMTENQKKQFAFEDLAGIYTKNGKSNLFAVCVRHPSAGGQRLTVLPAGTYLCANCSEENREKKKAQMLNLVKKQQRTAPDFLIEIIVITGILQWNYQIQLLWEPESLQSSDNDKTACQ